MNRENKKSLASRLRHRITVQSYTDVDDGQGGVTRTWSNENSYWASVNPISADKRQEYRSSNIDVTHYMETRGDCKITEANRLLFKGGIFIDLLIRDPLEIGDLKVILCKEVKN